MPRTFDIKTKKDITPSGTSNPCGVCRRQFAKYTCPTCNLQYCSLMCYRSEAHSQCTEVFYKTSLAEQIQGEPARSDEEKKRMLELLKRFEESTNNSDEGEEIDDVASRLEGINLGITDYKTIWDILTEEEKQRFLQLVADPASDESQRLLDAGSLADTPWWISDVTSRTAPTTRAIPEGLLKTTQFNPMLLYNVFHVSLSYAYTIRTFGISAFNSGIQVQDEVDLFRNLLLPLSPFLTDRKSSLIFTSVDGVMVDWTSRLPEPPTPEFVRVLLTDAQTLFRSHPVVDSTENPHSSCMRFISDILGLVEGPKKYAHITHKLTFYLALISNLPTRASRDLIEAIRAWETKNRDNLVMLEPSVHKKPLVEEL
ncbi:Zinc finger HIT domain-containing protein [Ceratobasidium sp. AG-Ba]|nr:Zinc finger HIT domain-containing protein [Ceratobasidium sp. AG-Ba]QRW02944.1 Zinc finger HIT domain-containing protein [Ceratobasidium sp. AG-Ba]